MIGLGVGVGVGVGDGAGARQADIKVNDTKTNIKQMLNKILFFIDTPPSQAIPSTPRHNSDPGASVCRVSSFLVRAFMFRHEVTDWNSRIVFLGTESKTKLNFCCLSAWLSSPGQCLNSNLMTSMI